MEVLKGAEVLKGLKVLKVLKSEGGVCNEWVTNKGWARFLYIVYILCAHNMGLNIRPLMWAFNKPLMNIYLKNTLWAHNVGL